MTITPAELALYVGALLILLLTPGPVWVALTARALAGGFHAAWPVALGVVVGDAIWPLLAILGVTWITTTFAGAMTVMKLIAAAVFFAMGALILLHRDRPITADSRLTRPGAWAGFLAGLAVILGNPKAILFYMGVLPGFFDLTRLTPPDIALIVAASIAVPLFGNLLIALFIDRARQLLTSPEALRRTNSVAGLLLILVGAVIPFT